MLLLEDFKAAGVVEGGGGVVEGAWADDDEETVQRVAPLEDGGGFFAGIEDGFLGCYGLGNLMLEEIRGSEGVVAAN